MRFVFFSKLAVGELLFVVITFSVVINGWENVMGGVNSVVGEYVVLEYEGSEFILNAIGVGFISVVATVRIFVTGSASENKVDVLVAGDVGDLVTNFVAASALFLVIFLDGVGCDD